MAAHRPAVQGTRSTAISGGEHGPALSRVEDQGGGSDGTRNGFALQAQAARAQAEGGGGAQLGERGRPAAEDRDDRSRQRGHDDAAGRPAARVQAAADRRQAGQHPGAGAADPARFLLLRAGRGAVFRQPDGRQRHTADRDRRRHADAHAAAGEGGAQCGRGFREAFVELRESRDAIAANLDALANGDALRSLSRRRRTCSRRWPS